MVTGCGGVNGMVSLTFTAGNQDALAVAGRTLKTGDLAVTGRPGASFVFMKTGGPLTYSITDAGGTFTVLQNATTLVIGFQILNSCLKPDTAVNDILITASVPSTFGLGGSTAVTTVNGVANFVALSVTTCLGPKITFTASSTKLTYAIIGQTLGTGDISVTGAANSILSFTTTSFISKSGGTGTVTMGVLVAPIILDIRDSCGIKMTSNSVTTVVATGGGMIPTNVLTVSGVASYSNLKFPAGGVFELTFTAGNENGFPVAGKSIVTGDIAVSNPATPTANIRFSSKGLFTAADIAPKSVRQNVPFSPTVLVEMLDSSGNADPTDSSVVITATTGGNTFELLNTAATMNTGVATFTNLTFSTCTLGTVILPSQQATKTTEVRSSLPASASTNTWVEHVHRTRGSWQDHLHSR